jgi:Rrf2 family protein
VPEGKYAMVKNIAEESEIPTHFLAKILQQLARKGFLRSSKGPTGGFALRKSPDDITLLEIVDAIDGLADYERCPSGITECNDEAPCGMHESWKELRSRIIGYLEGTTISDVARSLQQKREALAKLAKKRRSAKKN